MQSSAATPEVVLAGSQDFDVLVALIREFYAVDGHVYDPARVRASLPALLESDRYGAVWKVGDPAVGYVIMTWGYSLESGGREALVDEFYLRERGRGLGTAVMQQVLEDCRGRGFTRVFLETERANTRVRGFYQRLGFEEDDSVWMSQWLDDGNS